MDKKVIKGDTVFYKLKIHFNILRSDTSKNTRYEFKNVSRDFVAGLIAGNDGRSHHEIDCKQFDLGDELSEEFIIGAFEGGCPYWLIPEDDSDVDDSHLSDITDQKLSLSDSYARHIAKQYELDPTGTTNSQWKKFVTTHEDVFKPTKRYTCLRHTSDTISYIYEFDDLDFFRGLINAINIRDKDRRYKEDIENILLFDNFKLCNYRISSDIPITLKII